MRPIAAGGSGIRTVARPKANGQPLGRMKPGKSAPGNLGSFVHLSLGARAAVPSTVAHRLSAFNCGRALTLPKAAVTVPTVGGNFQDHGDLSQQATVADRRRAAAQAYMAIAPPST